MHSCVLALALVSCGPPEDALQVVYDPCAPVVMAVEPQATASQSGAVESAIAMWRRAAALAATTESVADAPRVPVRFQDAAGAFHGLYDDKHGIIYVNRDIVDDSARVITIAHEMGHAFGLRHVDPSVRPSLMNPGNTTVQPTAEDVATLSRMWGACSGRLSAPPSAGSR